ncbi:MAG: serine/threonine protein kinase [Gemmataceae bacterium]|nr:serine/threonine protein kinase [Gemmataceae bacterium]
MVHDPPSDRDARLALLLEKTAQRQQAGQAVDWAALRREHPDLADELRQLLAVGDVMQGLGAAAATISQASAQPLPTTPFTLPATFGDFELQKELGRGGMGVVYKAWDRKLERHVALKMILRGAQATSSDLARFRHEAGAAAALNHPNIVPVYQVGDCDGQPYFVMKLVAGQTLAGVVKAGPLPPRRAATYVLAIAQAVSHAHANGVLHRDLKPSNILIDGGDQPLVTDFGLAKRVEGGESLTRTGAILGTPSYMAPEQAEARARQIGPGIDVYSLGAILYELLTGRPPFLAASPVETLMLVCTEEPVRPRALNPRIDADLELICGKCLEKRPEHRYPDAAGLARDLQAFLDGEPVSARSSSLIYFVSRLFRETHHAPVLENWGVLWMWHSLQVIVLCAVTSLLHFSGVDTHLAYMALWGVGVGVWAVIFWNLRRRGGPVTFVERQIAHAWGAAVVGSMGVFIIEVLLGLPVLELSPVLAVLAGFVFTVKAGTLSGWFYPAAAVSYLVAVPMAVVGPPWSPMLFGIVSALSFFIPGLYYDRQRRAAIKLR